MLSCHINRLTLETYSNHAQGNTMKIVRNNWIEHQVIRPGHHVFMPYYTHSPWIDDDRFVMVQGTPDMKQCTLLIYSMSKHQVLKEWPLPPFPKDGHTLVSSETWRTGNAFLYCVGNTLVKVNLEDGCAETILTLNEPGHFGGTVLSLDNSLLTMAFYKEGVPSGEATDILVYALPELKLLARHTIPGLRNHLQFQADNDYILFAHEGETTGIDDRVNRINWKTGHWHCLHEHYKDLQTGEQLECIGHEMTARNANLTVAVRYPVSRIKGAVVMMRNDGERYCELEQDDFWHCSVSNNGDFVAADTLWWGYSSRKTPRQIDIIHLDLNANTKEVVKTIPACAIRYQINHPHPQMDATGTKLIFMEIPDGNPPLSIVTIMERV